MNLDRIIHYKNEVIQFIYHMNDIVLMPFIILTTGLVFLFMHGQRDKPILKNISIILGFIPVLIHELGHALTARLTGGKVIDIHMIMTHREQTKQGAQGYAKTIPRNRLSAILMTFMGYIMPPLIFYLGIILILNKLSVIYLLILALGVLFYLSKTRQIFIPLLMLVIILFTGYDLSIRSTSMVNDVLNIGFNVILGLLLGEMVQSILITGKMCLSRNGSSWDGKTLFKLTFIPSFVWFFIWSGFSVFVIYKCFYLIY